MEGGRDREVGGSPPGGREGREGEVGRGREEGKVFICNMFCNQLVQTITNSN